MAKRKHRTSVRVFSRPEFKKCRSGGRDHLLVGTHKNEGLAEKQKNKIGKFRLDSSCIKKSGKGYGLYVRYK